MHSLCSSCGKEIILPNDVQEYFSEDEHTKQCTCKNCNEKIHNSKKLIKYLEREHGNDGTYQMNVVCGKNLNLKELEDHMTTHSMIDID